MGDDNKMKMTVENGYVDHQEINKDKLEFFGARHTLALMSFLAITCVYALRVNLSVAIVAMVNNTSSDNDTSSESCPLPDNYDSNTDKYPTGEFEWDEGTQGFVLGAFYYGYALTNILGGRAAEYFGGKLVAGIGIILTAIFTILSPMAAKHSSGLFIAARILEGCSEGVLFPAINTLIAKWYPTNERSSFAAFIFAGMQFGTVVTLLTSGFLCSSDFLGGWPSAFYIFGVLAIVWGFFWFFLITDDPTKHPRISDAELKYIISGCPDTTEKIPVPWKSIVTSRYFWTIAAMHFGNNWGFYMLLTELPTYLDQILHINMQNNGIFSAMPYCGGWALGVTFGLLSSHLIKNKTLSIFSIRRLSMVLSGYGPMICLIIMCFVNCNPVLALIILFISGTLNGCSYCGYMSSHADISPRFAGTLMGLTNTIATIPGFTAPSVVGALTNGNQTLWAWREVFLIAVFVYLITTTIYVIFITTDIQPWNDPKEKKEKDKENHTENNGTRY